MADSPRRQSACCSKASASPSSSTRRALRRCLVFLHAIWLQAGAVSLKRFVLYGIAAFAAGVGVALLGYVVRYRVLSRTRIRA